MVRSGETTTTPELDTFDSLYESYRGKVYRVILRLVQNPSDAEDLTQATFLKISRNLPYVRRPESVPTWLYRIATNTALDHLRKSRSRDGKGIIQLSLEDIEPTPTDTPSPPASLDNTESATAVRDNIDQLPAQYRAVLVMHDLEGLPIEQVADVMGSSLGATKVRLHRARKRFAEICLVDCEQFYSEDGVLSCQLRSATHSLSPGVPVASSTHGTAPVQIDRS